MELVDDGGLADAGVSGNEHQLRSAAGDDAVESSEEGLNFRCSPVQFFGNQQPVWRVLFAERKFIDPAAPFPFGKTALKIARNAGSRLVALLSRLSEQLQDDGRKRARNILTSFAGSHRLSGDVTVHQLHWIGCREWKRPRQHFVKRYAESIEVAPRIDRAIHSSSLLGGHVGQCSSDELGRFGPLALTWKARSDPKAH